MGKRRSFRGISVGVTTLVVMFATICLTIFAVLALSTAKQEEKLSEVFAESEAAYMEADARCAAIANGLGKLWEEGAGIEKLELYANEVGAALSKDTGDVIVYYECAMGEDNLLCVTLRLGREFSIEQWQQVNIGEWLPDNSIDVWQGN